MCGGVLLMLRRRPLTVHAFKEHLLDFFYPVERLAFVVELEVVE